MPINIVVEIQADRAAEPAKAVWYW